MLRFLSLLARDRETMERLAEEMADRVRAIPPEQLVSYARTPWVESVERGGMTYRVEIRVEAIPGIGRRGVAIRVRRGRFPRIAFTSYIPANL